MAVLKDGERIDDLQYKGLRIIQNPAAFCFGTDAVLLSSFTEVRKNESVVDFCSGSGRDPPPARGQGQGRAHRGHRAPNGGGGYGCPQRGAERP